MSPRGPDLIFPGLDADDPIKTVSARLAGNSFVDSFEAIYRMGIVPAVRYAYPLTDLGAVGPFAWDGPYQGGEPTPINVGGDKAAAVRVNDDFTRYIAGTNTVNSGFATEALTETGKWYINFRACYLFLAPPVGSHLSFVWRPVGTGVYVSGNLASNTGPYALAENSWRTFTSPRLTLNSTEAFRSTARLEIGGAAPTGYIAMTMARVVNTP